MYVVTAVFPFQSNWLIHLVVKIAGEYMYIVMCVTCMYTDHTLILPSPIPPSPPPPPPPHTHTQKSNLSISLLSLSLVHSLIPL